VFEPSDGLQEQLAQAAQQLQRVPSPGSLQVVVLDVPLANGHQVSGQCPEYGRRIAPEVPAPDALALGTQGGQSPVGLGLVPPWAAPTPRCRFAVVAVSAVFWEGGENLALVPPKRCSVFLGQPGRWPGVEVLSLPL